MHENGTRAELGLCAGLPLDFLQRRERSGSVLSPVGAPSPRGIAHLKGGRAAEDPYIAHGIQQLRVAGGPVPGGAPALRPELNRLLLERRRSKHFD